MQYNQFKLLRQLQAVRIEGLRFFSLTYYGEEIFEGSPAPRLNDAGSQRPIRIPIDRIRVEDEVIRL